MRKSCTHFHNFSNGLHDAGARKERGAYRTRTFSSGSGVAMTTAEMTSSTAGGRTGHLAPEGGWGSRMRVRKGSTNKGAKVGVLSFITVMHDSEDRKPLVTVGGSRDATSLHSASVSLAT